MCIDLLGGHCSTLLAIVAGICNVPQLMTVSVFIIPACVECYFTHPYFWWLGIPVFLVHYQVTNDMVGKSFEKLDGSPFLLGMIYLLGLEVYGFQGLIYAPALVALVGFGIRMYNVQKNLELMGSLFTKKVK